MSEAYPSLDIALYHILFFFADRRLSAAASSPALSALICTSLYVFQNESGD